MRVIGHHRNPVIRQTETAQDGIDRRAPGDQAQ
jgi:hypothetical protein